MRSAKQKGSLGERNLVDQFWSVEGWCAHRIAGSGSSKYPSPDVIAGNGLRSIAIEAKVSAADVKYLTKEEIEALQSFASTFGAEPWVGVKFTKHPWFFFTIEVL